MHPLAPPGCDPVNSKSHIENQKLEVKLLPFSVLWKDLELLLLLLLLCSISILPFSLTLTRRETLSLSDLRWFTEAGYEPFIFMQLEFLQWMSYEKRIEFLISNVVFNNVLIIWFFSPAQCFPSLQQQQQQPQISQVQFILSSWLPCFSTSRLIIVTPSPSHSWCLLVASFSHNCISAMSGHNAIQLSNMGTTVTTGHLAVKDQWWCYRIPFHYQ